jgi:hypothetical protein
MDASHVPAIEYLGDANSRDREAESAAVEFVGGPRGGDRELLRDAPAQFTTQMGTYRRSVQCADDGAVRYVFYEDPVAIAHQRWIRPC